MGLGDTSVVADVPHRSDVLQFGIQKRIRHRPHAQRLEGQRHDGARVSTSRAEALGRRVRRAGIGSRKLAFTWLNRPMQRTLGPEWHPQKKCLPI